MSLAVTAALGVIGSSHAVSHVVPGSSRSGLAFMCELPRVVHAKHGHGGEDVSVNFTPTWVNCTSVVVRGASHSSTVPRMVSSGSVPVGRASFAVNNAVIVSTGVSIARPEYCHLVRAVLGKGSCVSPRGQGAVGVLTGVEFALAVRAMTRPTVLSLSRRNLRAPLIAPSFWRIAVPLSLVV